MNFSSLVLYGSCARGENNSNSDIDMLAIHGGSSYEMLYLGNLNVSAYPLEQAILKAKSGDLFISHVVYEGKIVTDKFGHIEEVFGSFVYKDSYISEKNMAADLAWYLILYSKNIDDYSMLNRRLAWCIRTMLIAEAAEAKVPVFSSSGLASFHGDKSVYDLIESKSSPMYSSDNIALMKTILLAKGYSAPDFGGDARSYFISTDNKVAVSTLAGQMSGFY